MPHAGASILDCHRMMIEGMLGGGGLSCIYCHNK